MITWGELKQDVYNMMMLEASEYTEYSNLIVSAANYTFMDLAKNFGKLANYEIVQAESDDEGYNEYDLITLTDDSGRTFLTFADVPVYKETDAGIKIVTDYKIVNDRYLYLKKTDDGTFKVNFKMYPPKIATTSLDTLVIDLEAEIINIAKLGIMWQLMIEDNIEIAVLKSNEYHRAKEEIAQRKSLFSGITINAGSDL